MKWNPLHWTKNEEKVTNFEVADSANEIKLFSIKDKQIDNFGLPFEAPSADEIKAGLITGFRDPKQAENPLMKYSQHFELYELAKINKKTGIITPYQEPKLHFSLSSLIE